jgi:ketol-acid reductoisomerase
VARIVTDATRAEMKRMLAEIQDGTYAREWILENQAGRPSFNLIRKREQNAQIERVGKQAPRHDELAGRQVER